MTKLFRKEDRRKTLAVGVIRHDRIVVALAGEGHPIFGGGQFLGQLLHILTGFEIRIGFHGDIEFAHRPAQGGFSPRQLLHLDAAGVAFTQSFENGRRIVAGGNHCIQRLPLVIHIAFGDLHQVGDEVVAPFKLNFDLGERIQKTVFQGNKAVVDVDDVKHRSQHN